MATSVPLRAVFYPLPKVKRPSISYSDFSCRLCGPLQDIPAQSPFLISRLHTSQGYTRNITLKIWTIAFVPSWLSTNRHSESLSSVSLVASLWISAAGLRVIHKTLNRGQ